MRKFFLDDVYIGVKEKLGETERRDIFRDTLERKKV